MVTNELLGPLVAAVALGAVHGIEPGHGWPVAASYALDRSNKWLYGLAASTILGVGHLVSSIAMVGAFFYAKAYFDLAKVNEPLTVLGGVRIGGPVSLVAGLLLVVLGVREYSRGHSHAHAGHSSGRHHHDESHDHHADSHDHPHGHDEPHHPHGHDEPHHPHGHDEAHNYPHDHDDSHDDSRDGLWKRLKDLRPVGRGHTHSFDGADEGGLLGLAWFAFLLGFAHEEEFEIIALCAGSVYCLELMLAYALTVVAGIVGLTMLLIGGYRSFEDEVERYAQYLPTFSAAVLVLMGLGFISGLF